MHVSMPTKLGQSFCTIIENIFEPIDGTDFEKTFSEFLSLERNYRRKNKLRTPKTPTFIHQIVRLAIKWFIYKSQKHSDSQEKSIEEFFHSERIECLEGMTEVGSSSLKEGEGIRHRTSWPFVLSVIQHILEKKVKTPYRKYFNTPFTFPNLCSCN